MADEIGLLRELVAIASPSTVSNLPLLEFVTKRLIELGWRVELFPYTDEAGVAKANLMAWPGDEPLGDAVDLAFVCHTDTVPYAADWPMALELTEREGQLHGCGACDVKGPLACFLAAVSEVSAAEVAPRFVLMLTADEEIGCKGMERLLAGPLAGRRIGAAIVSEPTSLRAGVAGKGYGLARVMVMGREAHSAFPGQGVSAISLAARLISAIEDRFAAADRTDELFDPPQTTINVGVIEGGTAKNILAGRCTFLVEWRAIPSEPRGRVLGALEALAREWMERQAGVRVVVEGLRDEPGFAPGASGPLRDRLARLLSDTKTGISFGSEASRLARIADEVIVIGPGDMRTAHSERECVPVAELELWTRTLERLLRDGLRV
jgi:acetylornithine deacetylase